MQTSQRGDARSGLGWAVLVLILGAETIGCAILVAGMLKTIVVSPGREFLALDLSVLAALLLMWIWVIVALVGAIRTRASWVRGSAVTIHVLLFAAGTGVLQGILGTQALGWALVLLSFAGFGAALLARPALSEPVGGAGGDGDGADDL